MVCRNGAMVKRLVGAIAAAPVAAVSVAAAATLLLAGQPSAAGPPQGLCDTATGEHPAPPYLAILSAFPAELAPLVAAA